MLSRSRSPSVSSAGSSSNLSLKEEDLSELAAHLSTPKAKSSSGSNNRRSNIFRSVRMGTPTMMLRNRNTGSGSNDAATPTTTEGIEQGAVAGDSDPSSHTFRAGNNAASADLYKDEEDLRGVPLDKTFDDDEEEGHNDDDEMAIRHTTTALTMQSELESSSLATSAREHGSAAVGLDRRISSSTRHSSRAGVSRHSKLVAFVLREDVQTVLYLSTFAIFGSTLRIYLSRFFGADCERPDAINDFLTPASSKVCVTATGRTEQTGGALFVDLPANMFGSFIMGLMTSVVKGWPALPWLKSEHPLQRNTSFHVGIKTGLCGSLTTFASWNAQMVIMLDGTATELGPQIVPVLYGYAIGLQCALASFVFGRQVCTWLDRWRNPHLAEQQDALFDEDGRVFDEQAQAAGQAFGQSASVAADKTHHQKKQAGTPHSRRGSNSTSSTHAFIVFPEYGCAERVSSILNGQTLPYVLVVVLLMMYVVADVVMGFPFYRTMWLSALLTPPGVLLRWRLSRWNGTIFQSSPNLKWIPFGTLAANVIGSLVSVLALALETRYRLYEEERGWGGHVLDAIKLGFAGSLSTVSTFAKETTELSTKYPAHAKAYHYSLGTIICACALSLCLYSPIVRSG